MVNRVEVRLQLRDPLERDGQFALVRLDDLFKHDQPRMDGILLPLTPGDDGGGRAVGFSPTLV